MSVLTALIRQIKWVPSNCHQGHGENGVEMGVACLAWPVSLHPTRGHRRPGTGTTWCLLPNLPSWFWGSWVQWMVRQEHFLKFWQRPYAFKEPTLCWFLAPRKWYGQANRELPIPLKAERCTPRRAVSWEVQGWGSGSWCELRELVLRMHHYELHRWCRRSLAGRVCHPDIFKDNHRVTLLLQGTLPHLFNIQRRHGIYWPFFPTSCSFLSSDKNYLNSQPWEAWCLKMCCRHSVQWEGPRRWARSWGPGS